VSTSVRERWLARFAAAGPKRSTPEERRQFAELLSEELAWAIIWGRRQQAVAEIIPRVHDAAVRARDAFRALHAEIGRTDDGLAFHIRSAPGVEIDGYEAIFEDDGRDAIACYLDRFADLAEEELAKVRRHRGPRNELAVMVAMAIAWTYRARFGERPAIGRRGVGRRKSPFDRICDEVEELLEELGHRRVVKGCSSRFTLSDPARKKGIKDAMSGKYDHVTNVDDQGALTRTTLWLGDPKIFRKHLRAAISPETKPMTVAIRR
jgi:hypothetical protein